jgi:superfamily II DNA helicase RecQ
MVQSLPDHVLDTLETLIAPGGRSRLSPYVEEAQLQVLFGEVPQAASRARHIRELINRHQERVAAVARQWDAFRQQGARFVQSEYSEEAFLDTYLIQYFSVNVAKVQLMLLELTRRGKLSGELRVLDIGVGPGTTAIAVLDFLLLLELACDLWSEPFPITDLRFLGLDCNDTVLAYARRVAHAFADALQRRLTSVGADRDVRESGGVADAVKRVYRWAERVAAPEAWQRHDLAQGPAEPPFMPNLVVAGNVLTELRRDGRSLAHFNHTLRALPPGALVLVMEPGSEWHTPRLMGWRRELLAEDGGFLSLAPCGQEFGARLPDTCANCWNARREDFHRTELYKQFQERSERLKQAPGKKFDDFANDLLSWSYVLLERAAAKPPNGPTQAPAVPDVNPATTEQYTLRGAQEYGSGSRWRLVVCPAAFQAQRAEVHGEPGFHHPPLRHGDQFIIERPEVERDGRGRVILGPRPGGETRIAALTPRQPNRAFLPRYDGRVRRAVDEIAHRLFGFAAMRPFQHRILERVLTGQNILAIAATGSGKSECYILPAMLLPGVTLVVSPLKSLMADQYDQRIQERYGLDGLTTYINGDVPFGEREARLKRVELGFFKLVYFTPEQLQRRWIRDILRRADAAVGIRYLALDEAHCISQWGHDFRPAYLNLVRRLREHGIEPRVIALTATASPPVRADVCLELGLENRPIQEGGDVYVESSNRPELNLIVRVVPDAAERADSMIADLRRFRDEHPDGAALVFLPWAESRDRARDFSGPMVPLDTLRQSPRVMEFAGALERDLGERVAVYHSRMDRDDEEEGSSQPIDSQRLGDLRNRRRSTEQAAFINGERRIMVATKGFGMGIDKPNIRLVVHRTPPANLEAYWQEAGRAGRDGEEANVILYYTPQSPSRISSVTVATEDSGRDGRTDYEIQHWFFNERYTTREHIEGLREFLLAVLNGKVGLRLDIHRENGRSDTWLCFRSVDLISFLRTRAISFSGNVELIVEKLLTIAMRVRPEFEGQHRLAFIEQFHESTDAIDGFKLIDPAAIVNTNAYFGDVLRAVGIRQPHDLQQLLHPDHRRRLNLQPVASRLGLTLHETYSLLSDIRLFQGKIGNDERWQPALLDFKPKKLDRWEVQLGPLALDDARFPKFVDAFMAQHDERKQNDWESYQYLLTDYIGVSADGTAGGPAQARCLRAVLLGYMQTDEVVVDNRCGSCNRCVPDERFEPDLEQRRRRVRRMGQDIERLLRQLEGYVDTSPPMEVLTALFASIEAERRRGSAIHEYLLGWTGRVLQDTPDHRGALWFRLQAIAQEVFDLASHAHEIEQHAARLARLIDRERPEEAERLLRLLDQVPEVGRQGVGFYRIRADLCRRLNRPADEAAALERIAALASQGGRLGHDELIGVYERLSNLYAPTGPVPTPAQFVHYRRSLAKLRTTPKAVAADYAPVVAAWTWTQVQNELRAHQSASPEPLAFTLGLLSAWVRVDGVPHAERIAHVLDHLVQDDRVVAQLAEADERSLDDLFGADNVRGHRPLAVAMMRRLMDTGRTLEAVERAVHALTSRTPRGEPTPVWQLLLELLRTPQALERAKGVLGPFLDDPQRQASLMSRLISRYQFDSERALRAWLSLFPLHTHRTVPLAALTLLRATAAVLPPLAAQTPDQLELTVEAEDLLYQLITSGDERMREEAHRLWLARCAGGAEDLVRYFTILLASDGDQAAQLEEVIDRLLDLGNRRALHDCVLAHATRLSERSPRLRALATCTRLAHAYARLRGGIDALSDDARFAAELRSLFLEEGDPISAEMLLALLRADHAVAASPRPALLALRLEALCRAGRFDEADALARRHEGLWVERSPTQGAPGPSAAWPWRQLLRGTQTKPQPQREPAAAFIDRMRRASSGPMADGKVWVDDCARIARLYLRASEANGSSDESLGPAQR